MNQIPKQLRRLCPTSAAPSLVDINLRALVESGKKVALLDVDNTLLPWHANEVCEEILNWLTYGRHLGLEFCLVSNTNKKDRLMKISQQMNVPFVQGKFKPSREMFLKAIQQFGATHEQVVMIGDQLFTDIWGANRTGIQSIWVKPMSQKEFFGTKLSRLAEQYVQRYFEQTVKHTHLVQPSWYYSRLARQFVKFCTVGISSTAIDLGLHGFLLFNFNWPAPSEAFLPLKIFTVSMATLNGFYWNRIWTFRIRERQSRKTQLLKYASVATLGLGFNTLFASWLYHLSSNWFIASFTSSLMMALWNFTGQRLWVFR